MRSATVLEFQKLINSLMVIQSFSKLYLFLYYVGSSRKSITEMAISKKLKAQISKELLRHMIARPNEDKRNITTLSQSLGQILGDQVGVPFPPVLFYRP